MPSQSHEAQAIGEGSSKFTSSQKHRKRPPSKDQTPGAPSKRRHISAEDGVLLKRRSRKKLKRKRSLKGKEKAATSDEDDKESNAAQATGQDAPDSSESQQVAKYLLTSLSRTSTLSTPPTSTPDMSQTLLQKELVSKNELITKQTGIFNSLQGLLQCQICLEMLWSPYSLSPCGHISCESCLVAWFSARPEHEPADPFLAPPTARKKTCPTCRTEVRTRPIVAYLVKSAVHAILPCLDPSSFVRPPPRPQPHLDPWKDIFAEDNPRRDAANGMVAFFDEEDGGVLRCTECLHEMYDGMCTGCGRLYDEFEDNDDGGDSLWGGDAGDLEDGYPGYAHGFHLNPPFELFDEEDGPYESDFIDDGDMAMDLAHHHVDVLEPRRLHRATANDREQLWISEDDDDDEPIELPPPRTGPRSARPASHRPRRGDRNHPMTIVSSSEDEDDDYSRPRRRIDDSFSPPSRRAHASSPQTIINDTDDDVDWVPGARYAHLATDGSFRHIVEEHNRRNARLQRPPAVLISDDSDEESSGEDPDIYVDASSGPPEPSGPRASSPSTDHFSTVGDGATGTLPYDQQHRPIPSRYTHPVARSYGLSDVESGSEQSGESESDSESQSRSDESNPSNASFHDDEYGCASPAALRESYYDDEEDDEMSDPDDSE